MVGGDFTAPDNGADASGFTRDGGRTWRPGGDLAGYRSGVDWVSGARATLIAVGPTGSDVSYDGARSWRPFDTAAYDAVDCVPRHVLGERPGRRRRRARPLAPRARPSPVGSATIAVASSGEPSGYALARRRRAAQLRLDAGWRSAGVDGQQVLQHRAHAAADLDRAGAVAADLANARSSTSSQLGRAPHDPHVARRVARERRLEVAAGELAHQHLEHVERLHGRRRVVDGGRQRADRRVDDDPHRERRVLLDRPLVRDRRRGAQLARVEPAAVDAQQLAVRAHVLTDPGTSSITAPAARRGGHEPVRSNARHHAGTAP